MREQQGGRTGWNRLRDARHGVAFVGRAPELEAGDALLDAGDVVERHLGRGLRQPAGLAAAEGEGLAPAALALAVMATVLVVSNGRIESTGGVLVELYQI